MNATISCLRPDSMWCEHEEEAHIRNDEFHTMPLVMGMICVHCSAEFGHAPISPANHEYNPHILTEGGWLPCART